MHFSVPAVSSLVNRPFVNSSNGNFIVSCVLVVSLTFGILVYFLYPETSGVRLEDMDALFGDATSAMPTPATPAERGSLMGVASPVPSLDIRRAQQVQLSADYAIPGLDIDPPVINIHNGKSARAGREERGGNEGIGGWISNMISRDRDPRKKGGQGEYSQLGQEDED
jgi:hypothetical protein